MRNITEKEAEDLLEKEGFNVAKREFIHNKEELKKIKINFPWVMKISSKKIVHKAKVGGVILNVNHLKEAEKAFDKLKLIKGFEAVLIQEMLPGVQTIVGLKKTPEFGLVIMFGKGGGNVEQEKDVSFRITPLSLEDADEMIKEVKFYEILKKTSINLDIIKKELLSVSKLAEKYPNILELDINPLIVNSHGATIVDARAAFE